jgi:predicted MPP superfamily phosphohydrolase
LSGCKNSGLSSRERQRRTMWAAVSACLIAAAVDAFLIEPKRLVFERVDIPIWNLPEAFDGYRIAILADLHYPRWTSAEDIQRAIALANAFEPDLIAIPGDICDKMRHKPAKIPNLSGLFDNARATDGIVGVLGNHDHWFHAESIRRELAKNTPVKLIENTSICVERAGALLAIGGVGDLWDGIVAPERTFAGVPLHVPRILLSHNPDLAEEMRDNVRVDVQLSGHTHGGQVCIPFGPALKVPSRYGNKFRAGLVRGKHHRVYISRGVASERHIRFLCPPEVTGVTLRTSNDPRLAPT